MKFTNLVIDFDGVIANTHKVYLDFLVKKLNFSQRRAELRIQKSSTEIVRKHDNFVGKIIEKWYYWNFFRFLKNYDDLLFEDRVKEILSIKLPKAILTRNYAYICQHILKDYFFDYQLVLGKETVSNKVKGMEIILSKPGFDKKSCLFITDTVADVVEVSKILPLEQIYAVDWGFNQSDFLEKHLPKEQIFHQDFYKLFELLDIKD